MKMRLYPSLRSNLVLLTSMRMFDMREKNAFLIAGGEDAEVGVAPCYHLVLCYCKANYNPSIV
jgi:hypothetical protein